MIDMIYIAGYGRSGSTILDILFDNNPNILGAGELGVFFEEADKGTFENAGYEVWRGILTEFQQEYPHISLADAAKITRRVEGIANLVQLTRENVSREYLQNYREIWLTLIGLIRRHTHSHIIVDSSKTTRIVAGRVVALQRLCGFQVHIIHLVRDPRAVTWSAMRGSNRTLESGKNTARIGSQFLTPLSWLVANTTVHLIQSLYPTIARRLRYEDLMKEPLATLTQISKEWEVDLGAVLSRLQKHEPLQGGCGIAGNRLRREGVQHLQFDDEWQQKMPAYAKIPSMISCFPLAKIYGY